MMLKAEKLVGSLLSDRYEVLDKIGTGGMAMVYKAHDRVLDRDVAIKILRDNFEGNSDIVSNFIREARSSASLVHPNVVSVYDVCEYQGLNYMVMELVDGITLKQYIKKHPRLPWQEACDYAIQIGQGIQAAHERGIIHRDIKPQNIIMAPGGVLKVTDFGIAKAMESDTSTAGGTATGSVHYISPEQAKGGFTDFRSDIYSLGICLYEMLAGRVPFDGDDPVSVALMHIEEEPVNVKCVNMDIPSDLAYVTMKAMNRSQSKRYQKMKDLLDDLRATLADEPLPSKEAEEAEKEAKKKREQAAAAKEKPRQETPEPASADKVTKKDMTNRGRKTRVKTKKKNRQRQKREDRNSVILALATVAALMLIIGGVFMIIFNPFAKTTVPDLTGMTIEEASNALTAAGYTLDSAVEYSLSDTVETDKIISQNPAAGTEGRRDEAVHVIVSLGATDGGIPVPDVTGLDVDSADKLIEESALRYWVVSEYSDTVDNGYIIRQSPAAGTHINEGDYVTIYMSTGSQPSDEEETNITVPNLIGMYRDNANAELLSAGLAMGTVTRKASSSPEGTVIMQSPAAGASVTSSTAVTIVLSSGNPDTTLGTDYTYTPSEDTSDTAYDDESDYDETYDESDDTYSEDTSSYSSESDTSDYSDSGSAAYGETSDGGSSTKIVTVKIPDGANDTVNVEVVVDGNVVHNEMHNKTEGAVAVEISGTGSASVQAYIDGAKVSDKTVTF